MSFARILACFTVFLSLHAAELPDPTTSWHPHHLIGCLAALRAPLYQAPQDQDLLGRAQMAYVELAFGGPAEANGAAGPWLDYAEQISTERHQLRNGKPTTTFSESLPDIWLDIVRGDTVSALANLEHFPEVADTAAARAARLAITRDLRAIRDQPPSTPLEDYAYIATCYELEFGFETDLCHDLTLADPLAVAHCDYTSYNTPRYLAAIRNVYADVAWMLGSSRIPEELALNHLRKLFAAFKGTAAVSATRLQLIAAINARIDEFAGDRVEPLIAAYGICRELRSGERGLRDERGKFRLVGYGDVALWLQDRLYSVSARQANTNDDQAYRDQAKLIEAAFPGSLIAARTQVVEYSTNAKSSWLRVGEAMIHELDDPVGLSPGTAIKPIENFARWGWAEALPNFMSLVRRMWPNGVVNRRWGIPDIIEYQPNWRCRDVIAPLAHAAYVRDPYSAKMWIGGRQADPAYAFINTEGLKPIAERIEAQVDYPTLPIGGIPPVPNLGARWQGWLQFPAEGTVTLGLESDESARLIVGNHVLMRYGTRGISEQSITSKGEWLPLTLEWYQGQKRGKIRLIEKDAAGKWKPIPATRLAHGENHMPGLQATYWSGFTYSQEQLPRAIEHEMMTRMPWQIGLQAHIAISLINGGQAQKAVDFLRPLRNPDLTNRLVRWRWQLALARSQNAENGADLITEFARNRCLNENLYNASSAAVTINRSHLQESYAASVFGHEPCCVEGYTIARTAITRCAWNDALKGYSQIKLGGRNGVGKGNKWEGEGKLEYPKSVIEIALIQRAATGTEPNWEDLRALSMDNANATPSTRLFLSWLVGDVSWETAVKRMASVKDGEEILWYRGLYEVTIGNYDDAKKYLAPMMTHNPTWYETADADGLLFWLAKQSPSQLAALPKAKPLPARPGQVAEPINF